MSKMIRKTGCLFLVLTLAILLIFTGILSVQGTEKVDFSPVSLSYGDFDYIYSGNNDTISILKYNGSDKSVEIPSIIDGTPVIGISDFAFMNNEAIEQVTIPDSVQKIGLGAFYHCNNLTEIKGAKNVDFIDGSAFSGTSWYNEQKDNDFIALNSILISPGKTTGSSLVIPDKYRIIASDAFKKSGFESVIFPEGLKVINPRAFIECNKLKEIILPKSVEIIYYSSFAKCNSLTSVYIPNGSIGDYAFSSCENLKKVVISNNVKSIYYNAFIDCYNLKNIVIPSSVSVIGENAIGYASDKKIPGVTIFGYPDSEAERYATDNSIPFVDISQDLITDDGKFRYHINDDTTVTITHYLGEEKIVTVPDTINGFDVTNIGKRAFSNNNYIENVYLPDNLQSIGAFAFMECANLKAIDIPNSVERIEENAFCKCTILTEVSLPDRLTKIKAGLFEQCENLKEIMIPQSVTCIEEYAFSSCTELAKIEIPQSLEIIGEDAFRDTTWYNNQPNGAIYIDHILYHYKGKAPHSLTIEEGTTYISPFVFDDGQDLEEINFPDSLRQIGYGALFQTAWMDNQPYGEVIYAGRIAYQYKLSEEDYNSGNYPEEIIIKNGTTAICDFAFDGTKVHNVFLPDSLEIIGNGAFWDCNISEITIPKNVQQIGENAFAVKYGTCLQTIRGYKGTAAERYAKENEITFITLEELVNSILGDADGDGEVGVSDTTIIQRRLTNTSVPYPEETLMNADVDGDSELTILDATFIQRHIAKINVPYPIGEPKK